jgi:hypothetical protein
MKIEKPKRYYKRVADGDQLPLTFCYHHLPLIQKLLDFKDPDLAHIVGVPIQKLKKTMQMLEPLPERINQGMNTLLIQRFRTANICWIALNTWANPDWGSPEILSDDGDFHCRYIHPDADFEVVCDSQEAFRVVISSTGTTLNGTYGFTQVNPFFDVLDEMIKLDSSEWIEFWPKAQIARRADLEKRLAIKAQQAADSNLQINIISEDSNSAQIKIKKNEIALAIAEIEREAYAGDTEAKYSAGRALAMGLGMEKPDLEKAVYWLALATSEGHFQAGKLLVKLKKTLFEKTKILPH